MSGNLASRIQNVALNASHGLGIRKKTMARLTEEQEIFEPFKRYGQEPIFEMANIMPDKHKFGVALKMNIMQPGDKMYSHGPRVKFFKNKSTHFSISINKDPSKIELVDGDYALLISERTLNQLIEKVKKYRVPLLNMWHDSGMSQDELLAQMSAINEGKTVRLRKPNSFA